MPDGDNVRAPANYRWLIRLASWIVPPARRSQWRQKREREAGHWYAFLSEHGGWDRDAQAQLLRHCWRAFPDAVWHRFDRQGFLGRLHLFLRSPAFCLGLIAIGLAGLVLATRGFAGTRAAFAPLPYSHPRQLVACSRTGAFGVRIGVPPRTVRLWQTENKTLSRLAAHFLRRTQLSASALPQRMLTGAWVTEDFFPMLGASACLGRIFQAGDASAQPLPVILSYRLWREGFAGDPAVVGRPLLVDDRPAVVVGVLSRSFWAISQRISVWAPFDPTAQGVPALVGAVGRLRPGVTAEAAGSELRAIARAAKSHSVGAATELAYLEDRIRPSVPTLAAALLLTFALATVPALLLAGRPFLAALGRGRLGYVWRYWSWFTLKTALLLAGLSALWLELTASRALNLNRLTDPVPAVPAAALFVLAFMAALCFSLHDQRRRCPVCLYRLVLPVTIGSWSSPLLEPVSTELLCEHGHGTLCVPGTGSSASEPERWRALDESWRELFTEPKG